MRRANGTRTIEHKRESTRRCMASRRGRIYRILVAVKEAAGCADCQQDFPHFVLEFDHVGPKTRKVSSCSNWTQLWRELDVCDVVCANCHNRRTHERRIA